MILPQVCLVLPPMCQFKFILIASDTERCFFFFLIVFSTYRLTDYLTFNLKFSQSFFFWSKLPISYLLDKPQAFTNDWVKGENPDWPTAAIEEVSHLTHGFSVSYAGPVAVSTCEACTSFHSISFPGLNTWLLLQIIFFSHFNTLLFAYNLSCLIALNKTVFNSATLYHHTGWLAFQRKLIWVL